MRYELKTLISIIDSLLASQKGEVDFNVPGQIADVVNKVSEETNHIKKALGENLFNLKNDRKVERYIQHHQCSLIRMCNSLMQHVLPESFQIITKDSEVKSYNELIFFVNAHLVELLTYIENYFGKYFNQDELIPKSYKIIGQMEFRKKLSSLKEPEKCEQFNIALYPIRDFVSQNKSISFRRLIYLKELYKEVDEKCSRCKEQKVDCKLSCSLIYLNFNSFKFFTYLTQKVKDDFSKENALTSQIEKLSFHLKKLNQAHTKPNFSFKPKQDTIKEQVANWILEEMSHLEKIHQLSLQFPKATAQGVSDNFKLITELSVPQVAYFIRILVDTGVIKNKNHKELIGFFAKHIKTKKTNQISVDSFRSKYYNNEGNTKDTIREMVITLLNETQKAD